MIEQAVKPDLKTYLNVHLYLEDLYKFRKATEAHFSYESWSQELEIRNRSFLRQIVIGKRSLTSETSKLLCERLNFEESEREYFELLVLYSKRGNQEQRNFYGRKLMQLLKTNNEQVEIEKYYELVSTPLYPKIRTLLSFRDIRKDTASIARLLGAKIQEIEEGLEVLQKMQLISFDEKSQEWQSTEASVKVPDCIGDAALLDYHSKSLHEAIAAQNLPKNQRRYKALILPLSENEFTEFLDDLQVFVKQSLKKFDVDDLRTRKLHQVNFNIYAVSEEPEIASETDL